MKTTHRWIAEHCQHGKTAEETADILRSLGHEVAGLTPLPDGDAVLELEITANRPDCLSALGLAHELSAATGAPLRQAAADLRANGKTTPPERLRSNLESEGFGADAKGLATTKADFFSSSELSLEDPKGCPFYAARLIHGVKVGPSPAWLAARLEAIGLKPISNVVDVTNYVLYALGQPLHAFDAGRLAGGRIRIRRAAAGERLKTLDGVERALTPEMLVIADAERPAALAGVMGGEPSAVTAATKDVVLESALFDPAAIRKTSRTLKLASDSSYRFERGVDPEMVERASDRAAALIVEVAGGTIGPLARAGVLPKAPPPFRLRRERLARILGAEIPPAEVERILKGLGCGVKAHADHWEIQPPSRRARDLRTEAEAAEEVARVRGYDRIPGRIALPARAGFGDPARELSATLSERLRAAGFHEAVTTSFCDAKAGGLRLTNPMSEEQTHLRHSLLPGLMSVLGHNQDVGETGGRFFELGRVHGTSESWRLALAGEGDLRLFKGALLSAFADLGIALEAKPGNAGDAFAPGRSVLLSDIGAVGLASDSLVRAHGLRSTPVLAEVALDTLVGKMALHAPRFQALPRFPAVDRDLAVVVDERVSWVQIEQATLDVPCAFREKVGFFDLYRGKQAGAGKKSIAFSIRFRHPERTLTGEEVDAVMARTIASLEKACGAQVRR